MLIAVAVVVGVLVAWQLAHVLLLAFGAVLFAVLLRALTNLITRYTPLGDRWALAISAAFVALLIAGFMTLLGAQIRAEFETLIEGIPDLIKAVEETLGVSGLREWVEDRVSGMAKDGDMVGSIAAYSGAFITGFTYVLLVVFSGLYLAADPQLYRRGLAALFPRQYRQSAEDALGATGNALTLWLIGKLVAMALVGALTTAGLWLIGVPSALALGFVAALLEFVPFVGPILAAAPAIALGLTEGPTTAVLVLGLYVVIQQVEGNLITPLVQQRAVDLPPALTMFAILAFGVLLGPLGILLATPLAVVCYVLVSKLWIRDVLKDSSKVPGEEGSAR
ncbi:AI-2E family transporter [Palleronia sp.]|uniref:AI-2E family transporter n=1 Tax=Palleronia sp. TaxID=1940284 RepID=UPI0035C851E6